MTQTLMIDWFQTLDPQVKPYWAIAIVMSVIFIIQMILTFIGIGDTDADADFGTDMPDGVNLPDGHALNHAEDQKLYGRSCEIHQSNDHAQDEEDHGQRKTRSPAISLHGPERRRDRDEEGRHTRNQPRSPK